MRIYVETYGCQMNEYDTELVKSILTKENYAIVKTENEADIIMLNTCAVRENAHRKVYGRVHDIHHRREGRPVMIGILGCMATNLRQELFENRNLKIDFIAGPDSYKRLPELIHQAQGGDKAFDLTLSEFETYSDVFPARKEGVNAWIAIMRGCNNFCTFCVVPYTRGRERSRSVSNIVDEVRVLTSQGFKQVTLLGQNVNSYFHDTHDFAHLLEEVSRVDGIERIRFTSPHPKDFPDRLLQVIAQNPKVCKQVHLPLQSGNDRVLDLMNRTYTQKEFLDLVEKIRKLIPGVALSTDVIVGFPTEKEEDFEDTLNVMRQVEFDSAFMFIYSERKNTVAAKKFPDDVPQEIKSQRFTKLSDLQKAISLKKNQSHIGQIHRVVVESLKTAKSDQNMQGRNDANKIVILPKKDYPIGHSLDVKIINASVHVLIGEYV